MMGKPVEQGAGEPFRTQYGVSSRWNRSHPPPFELRPFELRHSDSVWIFLLKNSGVTGASQIPCRNVEQATYRSFRYGQGLL